MHRWGSIPAGLVEARKGCGSSPERQKRGVTTVLGKGNASPEHTRHRTSVLGRLTCFSASSERLSGWFPRLSQLPGSV